MAKSLQLYDRDGATAIEGKSLADILSGTTDTAVKLGVKNTGDALVSTLKCTITPIGTNDGWSQLRIGRDLVTLSPPWNVATVVNASGSGGVFASTGVVYFVVTALNATGETIQSAEVQAVITVTTQTVTISWAQITGATKYRVYVSATSGTYGASSKITENIGVSSINFTYDGTAATSGTPPAANTTGGASPTYGSAPSMSTTPVTIGALASEQWVFLWVIRIVPVSVNDTLNPRLAGLLFAE